MKEFDAQTGGRYTYVDDIMNLQELSLAFGQIFDACDNFIISGCQIKDNSISSGYVYLNGKIRKFPGVSNIEKWPCYLCEANRTESVSYASGGSKVGRTVYGCEMKASMPTNIDPITGNTPDIITVYQNGGPTINEAFFGKYAVLINPALGRQNINGTLNCMGDIMASQAISSSIALSVNTRNNNSTLKYEGNDFVIKSKTISGITYKLALVENKGFVFYIDDTEKAVISKETITFNSPVSSNQGTFGGVSIKYENIFNTSNASDTGSININMIGLDGGRTYYRNMFIGNGRGTALISVIGKSGTIEVGGVTTFSCGNPVGIILKSNLSQTSPQLIKSVNWADSENTIIGKIGYLTALDKNFTVLNSIGDVFVKGLTAVNISPAIKENGVLLSNKYVLKENYENEMLSKADASSVYAKEDAESVFASKRSGLAQFISNVNTDRVLRNQIGALGYDDLNKVARLSNYLSDMAVTEEDKKKIRDNIGATSSQECQKKLKDSGWTVLNQTLFIRQIGNIVSIQGKVRTMKAGVVFTIPNSIDAPSHEVYQSVSFSNNKNWSVYIPANSKQCLVKYCDGSDNKETEFSITYMV